MARGRRLAHTGSLRPTSTQRIRSPTAPRPVPWDEPPCRRTCVPRQAFSRPVAQLSAPTDIPPAPETHHPHNGGLVMTRTRTLTLTAAVVAVALTAAACSSPTGGGGGGYAAAAATADVTTSAKAVGSAVTSAALGPGTALVDGTGRALYLFDGDTGTASTCAGACASVWPPLPAPTDPPPRPPRTRRSAGQHPPRRRHHPAHLPRAPAVLLRRRSETPVTPAARDSTNSAPTGTSCNPTAPNSTTTDPHRRPESRTGLPGETLDQTTPAADHRPGRRSRRGESPAIRQPRG